MREDTIEALIRKIIKFRDERNWKQFHNPKDMIISLSLEAAELLELTQWKNETELKESLEKNNERAAEELADILYWVLLISHDLRIDLSAAFERKMLSNKEKYPLDKARNSNKKYTEFD